MRRREALSILGLTEETANEDAIKRAFRARMRQVHPDTADEPCGDVVNVMKRLRESKETLLTLQGNFTCKLCRGSGIVPTRFGSSKCGQCGDE